MPVSVAVVSATLPDAAMARSAVFQTLGWLPVRADRFPTGLSFFVFDAADEHRNVVVRLGRPSQAAILEQGTRLQQQLRALGVPLPETLASGFVGEFPFIIQSRLPGTDFGDVMNALGQSQLREIAHAVSEAQQATARLGAGRRYGYAAVAEAAPHDSWAKVIEAHIDRSESRLRTAGLFDPDIASRIRASLSRHSEALARIPATPHLHDTTTKNVIVAPSGKLSGIVDVDDLCFGDPRYPAALTKVAMLVHGGPAAYVDMWLAHSGAPHDSLFSFYVTVFLLDFMSEHGMTFNGNERPSNEQGRNRLLELMARYSAN